MALFGDKGAQLFKSILSARPDVLAVAAQLGANSQQLPGPASTLSLADIQSLLAMLPAIEKLCQTIAGANQGTPATGELAAIVQEFISIEPSILSFVNGVLTPIAADLPAPYNALAGNAATVAREVLPFVVQLATELETILKAA